MADGVVRTDEGVVVAQQRDVLVERHLVVHHRTNLQQVKFAGAVGMERDGEFDFDRTPHLLLAVLH